MDFRGLCVRWAYIGTMKKERILVLDLLKKHLEKAGK